MTPLWVTRMNQDIPIAAIALGFSRGNPQLPMPEVLRVIGEHLEDEEERSDVRTI